jgi:S-DNA-T family DNA segregation ATPase FtsK/SpoIIIE
MSESRNRPPRLQGFEFPQGEIQLPSPPEQPELRDPHWLVSVIPVMGIAVMALFYLLRTTTDSANSALFAVPLLLLALFTIAGTLIAQRWRRRDYEQQRNENMLQYIRLLQSKRARIQAAADAQRAILEQHFPEPPIILNDILSLERQVWEKHPSDPDFALFRVGLGRVPLSVRIVTPDPDLHSDAASRSFELANDYRFLHNVPVVLSLRDHAPLGLVGRRDAVLGTARAILSNLVWMHPPTNLQIVLVAPHIQPDDWQWLRWLPHTGNGIWLAFDTESSRRILAQLSQQLDNRQHQTEHPDSPHILVIFDNMTLSSSEAIYRSLLDRDGTVDTSILNIASSYEGLPAECRTIIDVHEDGTVDCIGTRNNPLKIHHAQADTVSRYDAQTLARALSAQNMQRGESTDRIPRNVEFLELYGVETVEQMQRLIHKRWQRDIPDGVLPFPVPIGRESLAVDTLIQLDEEHHGPHGVLAGTTGSGKSELLQTLIAALAIEHHPQWLNFLLIDFKGGSTFSTFSSLPHTVGMVTNLDGTLIRRVLDALRSEIDARQRYFKQINVRDIRQYYRFYTRPNTDYRPVPHLFVIVDEFAQLSRDMPDFLDELVRIAQLGRSLGIHLILATQSPMDVITDDINANLQFRICLRVQNIEASRAMLRRPDAAYLPSGWVGRGFLQVGERDLFKQFQTAYLGGDYDNNVDDLDVPILEIINPIGEAINLLPDVDNTPDRDSYHEPFTTGRAIVHSIRDYSQRHQIAPSQPLLLPPLDTRIALADILNMATVGGWDGNRWQNAVERAKGLQVPCGSAPIGLLDNVYERTQAPLWVHLNAHENRMSAKDGHVLIIGSPSSGKTTVLRTIAFSQALLHHPDELHMYFLSFTDGSLNDIADYLPHAERVIHGTEQERIRRLFGRLIHILQSREMGRNPARPRIVLFIDQYEQFRDMYYEQHMPEFERLLSEGRAAGIYLILTAGSIGSVSERMRSLVQQRIILRATDPSDYLIAIGAPSNTVEDAMPPGRGLVAHNPPLPCQISLPYFSAMDDETARGEVLPVLNTMRVAYQAEQNQSQSPLAIGELPVKISLQDLSQTATKRRLTTTLGYCDDDTLSPFVLEWFQQGPHFVITGPPATGKSNLLRIAAFSAAEQYAPQDLRLILIDFTGRSLRELAHLKHTLSYITDIEGFSKTLNHLEVELEAMSDRLPHTAIMIDNYDMLIEILGGDTSLLRQLRGLLRSYGDSNLYLWVSSHLEHIGDPLLRQLLMQRCGFGFSVKESLYGFNVRTNQIAHDIMPQGRAFFVQYSSIQTVQMAFVEDIAAQVQYINEKKWANANVAQWLTEYRRSSKPSTASKGNTEGTNSTDIDTAGLIEDLFGKEPDFDD